MAGLYEEQILGAKNRAETARRLREQAAVTGAPQGQMVGNYYVAPHWTQHLANAIRQYNLGSDEQEALKEASGLQRQQAREIADLSVKAGIPVSPEMIKRASVPAQEPGFIDRLTSALRGEEAKGVPEQVYQPPKIQNVTPDQREQALLSMVQVDPKIGGAMLDYMATKSHRQELAEDRQAAREERQQYRDTMLQMRRDQWNAVHPGQPTGESGINMGPRISTAQGGGTSSAAWKGAVKSGDIVQAYNDQGQPVFLNKRTMQVVQPPEEIQGFGKPKTAGEGRDVPAEQLNASIANKAVINQIDDAIKQVDTNQNAFGLKNIVGQAVMQRYDPEGVTPRSAVGEIGATKIHDLSGAAVMPSEAPRFSPFVPTSSDTPEKIKKNLGQMKKNLIELENERARTYSPEAGFKPQLKTPSFEKPKSADTSVDDLVKKYGGQ